MRRQKKRSSSQVTHRVGRGREGHDGHIGEVLAQNAKLEVVRSEVMTPAVQCLPSIRVVVNVAASLKKKKKQTEGDARICLNVVRVGDIEIPNKT